MKIIRHPLARFSFCVCWVAFLVGFSGWHSAAFGQSTSILAAKAAFQAAKSDSARASQSLALGDAFKNFSHDSAMHYYRQSITLSKASRQRHLLTWGYLALSYAYIYENNAVQSLEYLRMAQSLHPRHLRDSTNLRIGILTAINIRSQGDYTAGIRKCLSLLRDYEPPRQPAHSYLGMVYTELGVIYDHLKQYDKAAFYHLKQLAFAKKGSNRRAVVLAHLNLGAFYSNIGRKDEGEQQFKRALVLARRYNYGSDIAVLLMNLGDLAQEQHRYQEAIEKHTESMILARKLNAAMLHGLNLLSLATDYQAVGRYSLALAYADSALNLAKTRLPVDLQQQALDTKANLLAQLGRYRDALEVTRLAGALKDSTLGIEKQKAIAEVQGLYDLERKQNQITTLNKNLTIQKEAQRITELELSLAQRGRMLAVMTVALLCLVLAVGYWSYRSQQKARLLLQTQKDEISRQAEQLALLNSTKDKLFSIISHDLRSPVAHLKRGFYQISQSAQSPLRQSIDRLEGQVDHILFLLTNLLDWSHSQMTGFKSHLQAIELADTLAELLSQFSEQLRRKDIRIMNQIPESHVVQADKHQLHSVLRNILSNAIKFTSAGGFIRLQTSIEAGQVALRVQDTGIGMSADELARVLTDPVVRPGTEDEPGTGLGLRLCCDLLAQQGGTLKITSQPGKGTTVILALPIAKEHENLVVRELKKS